MENKIKDFTDLKTWQEGHKLVILVYKITRNFPKEEIYSLTSQMRRAVVSVTSNIAEGFGRQGFKEKAQFCYLSNGSLVELKNQVIIARDIGYLKQSSFSELSDQINICHKLLQGLIKRTKDLFK